MSSQTGAKGNAIDAGPRHFRAPGRINIIGEHTDYNDGLVLPINTALYTTVTASPRSDSLIRVVTRTLVDDGEFHIDARPDNSAPSWLAYVQGVALSLEAAGVKIVGANLDIDSDIPLGGGLSSSASLELAVARAMVALADVELSPAELAHACQRAEIDFARVNCGIMDQFSVACGKSGTAMLLDCRNLRTEFAALPADMSLIVTDSNVVHQHPASGYNDRATECVMAVRALRESGCRIETLRDVTLDMLNSHRRQLGDLLFRRARHVVTENARTLDAFAALNADDIAGLGALVSSSHASLRDDFEVSCDGIEILINVVSQCEGIAGSRMVGGGFGGCVLSVVDKVTTETVVEKIQTDYGKVIGRTPWVHVVTPAEAAHEVTQ